MVRTVIVAFGLALVALIVPTASNACSFDFPVDAAYQYDILNDGKINSPWAWQNDRRGAAGVTETFNAMSIIAIVQPSEHDRVDAPKRWDRFDGGRNYFSIRFEVETVLKGAPPAELTFNNEKGEPISVLSKLDDSRDENGYGGDLGPQSNLRGEFNKYVSEKIAYRSSFAFADAPKIGMVEMQDALQFTSCGPVFIEAFDFDRHYLVGINENGQTAFAEPLSGPNDPLVTFVSDYLETEQFGPTISPEAFFQEMETRDVVTIKSCSFDLTQRNIESESWDAYPSRDGAYFSTPDLEPEIQFSRSNDSVQTSTQVNLEKLGKNYPALFEYFQNRKDILTCTSGETFAVYADQDKFNPSYNYDIIPAIPAYRFARVIDGQVQIEDIRTNIIITGDKTLPVSTFLNPKHSISE